MKRTAWLDGLRSVIAMVALATAATAQPPEGGPPDRGPGGPPRDPLRAALDTDGDHELSAEEIKNASAAVAKLDRNGDGRIDNEEFRPPRPPGPPREGFEGRRPPRGEGFEGRPPREGRRPPGDGERPEGGPRGPSPERFVERALSFDADGDGKLDKVEMEKFAAAMQQRMRGGRGGPGGPPPEGGERPERTRRPE
jgi:hypothetical protein